MGGCQSTSIDEAAMKPKAKASTKRKKYGTKKSSPMESQETALTEQNIQKLTEELSPSEISTGGNDRKDERNGHSKSFKKGYSSGASSISSDTDSPQRFCVDQIGLEAIKTDLIANGTLNGNVVRMETPFGIPIEEIYDGVHHGEVLGSGVAGIIRLVTHRATGVKYAVKCLDLGLVTNQEGLNRLRDEIFIMCQLDHPNIVRLEEVYESPSEIYLVQELCTGGDLFDRLDEQTELHYTEAQCARLAKQMLSAVRYLHSKNIIHRDLKLENFVFSSRESGSVLKMIDFGLSKHFHYGEMHHDVVGTPYTAAPELIRGSYNERSDMWALGVITYLLLSGETPFGGCDGENLLQVRKNILSGKFRFLPAETWESVSDLAKDFVAQLLNLDPQMRPNARAAQRHEWIQTWGAKDYVGDKKLNPNVVRALISFKELSDMQKLLCEVLSFTLLPEQIKELHVEFEKIDNGNGEISLSALKKVLMENAEAGSLGGLVEEEVEDIFNALRVRKTEPRIRWHEFIAAGLSQCQVDERNLRLAFDRLDTDGKGYVTCENLMELVGSEVCSNREAMQMMWMESMMLCDFDPEQIKYDDFMVLMKGQTKELEAAASRNPSLKLSARRESIMGSMKLMPVQEGELLSVRESDAISPCSVVDELRSDGMINAGLNDESSGASVDETQGTGDMIPVMDAAAIRKYFRQRSRSLDATKAVSWIEMDSDDEGKPLHTGKSLPLQGRSSHDVHNVITDESKTPLVVNRTVYRAHRELRHAVLEASKRFEENHNARITAEDDASAANIHGAGLVLRRSVVLDKRGYRVESVENKAFLDRACERAGRPKRTNLKTVSDMTGMMGSPTQSVET